MTKEIKGIKYIIESINSKITFTELFDALEFFKTKKPDSVKLYKIKTTRMK